MIALLLAALWLWARLGGLWAGPSQAPLRQTVPSRTPTKVPSATPLSGGAASATPTATQYAATATMTPIPATLAPGVTPSVTPIPPTATTTPLPTATPLPGATVWPSATTEVGTTPSPGVTLTLGVPVQTRYPGLPSPTPRSTALAPIGGTLAPLTPRVQPSPRTTLAATPPANALRVLLTPTAPPPIGAPPKEQPTGLAPLVLTPTVATPLATVTPEAASRIAVDYTPFLGVGVALLLLVSGVLPTIRRPQGPTSGR
jgi:hypothetical protein